MTYVKIIGLPDFPEMSAGAGAVQFQKIYAYANRTFSGKMLLRNYKGSAMKITGKWALLTCKEFTRLCSFLRSHDKFDVEIYDPGSGLLSDGALPPKRLVSVYCGDIQAQPLFVDSTTGKPRYYQDCAVNFITVGLR